MLDAIAALRHEATNPFRIVIVGDGPRASELRRQAAALGLDDVVTWHGWRRKDQLLAQYQAADCFLNPSIYEGMPNTVLEAMACGLPVVASDVPGNDAVVVPGETGFLFRLGEVRDFLAGMHRVLADPMLARSLGEAGRMRTLAEFSWQNVAERYLRLLSRISVAQ